MEQQTEIAELLHRYLCEEITTEEETILNEWTAASVHNKALFDELTNKDTLVPKVRQYCDYQLPLEKLEKRLEAERNSRTAFVKRVIYWRRVGQVAALFLLFFLGCTVIPLNSNSYVVNEAPVTAYNTISTPGRGRFQLVLPDGSGVWLNAASSIRYPVAFKGKERKVEITGEGYFEVAKNTAKPFKVFIKRENSGNVEVEVFGTVFNISAYTDEPTVRTTLLEGKVKVTASPLTDNLTRSVVLIPGQQALVSDTIAMQAVQVDEAVAWKSDQFSFNNTDIKDMMRQLARWYDMDIVYKGDFDNKSLHFTGPIQRYNNVSEVLKLLEQTGCLHFDIEGRKIIVKVLK